MKKIKEVVLAQLQVQGRLKHSNWTFQNTLEVGQERLHQIQCSELIVGITIYSSQVFLVAGGSQFLQGAPGTGQASYTEAWEPQKRRFEVSFWVNSVWKKNKKFFLKSKNLRCRWNECFSRMWESCICRA